MNLIRFQIPQSRHLKKTPWSLRAALPTNKLEVQVIDRNDNIVVSTTGFQPTEQRMPDYEKAIKTGETETAKIKSASGEKVLASTTVIYDATGRRLGAYRWITSLNADKMICGHFDTCGCGAFGACLLCFFGAVFHKLHCKTHKGRKQYCA